MWQDFPVWIFQWRSNHLMLRLTACRKMIDIFSFPRVYVNWNFWPAKSDTATKYENHHLFASELSQIASNESLWLLWDTACTSWISRHQKAFIHIWPDVPPRVYRYHKGCSEFSSCLFVCVCVCDLAIFLVRKQEGGSLTKLCGYTALPSTEKMAWNSTAGLSTH